MCPFHELTADLNPELVTDTVIIVVHGTVRDTTALSISRKQVRAFRKMLIMYGCEATKQFINLFRARKLPALVDNM